jgi:hypothetical protein
VCKGSVVCLCLRESEVCLCCALVLLFSQQATKRSGKAAGNVQVVCLAGWLLGFQFCRFVVLVLVLARNWTHSKAQNYTMLLPCSYWRPCTTLSLGSNCPYWPVLLSQIPCFRTGVGRIASRSRLSTRLVCNLQWRLLRVHTSVRSCETSLGRSRGGTYAPPRGCASSYIWLCERNFAGLRRVVERASYTAVDSTL